MLNYWTIYFKSEKNIKNEIDNARVLHGVFFKIIGNANHDIATEYHDRTDSQRFTMSTIFHENNKEYKEYKQGDTLKFNISTYDERILKILNKFFREESIKILDDREKSFINFNDNKLYLRTVKADLIDEEYLKRNLNTRYSLKFITPTAFRVSPSNYPLPDPKKIFKSLNKKYFEIFNEKLISEEELEEIPRYVALENVNIQTKMATYKKYSFLGFIGFVTFKFKYKDKNLEEKISILANLIPFVGIGYKSGQGMGKCILL